MFKKSWVESVDGDSVWGRARRRSFVASLLRMTAKGGSVAWCEARRSGSVCGVDAARAAPPALEIVVSNF
jgi:hypothetical protein